MSNHPHRALKTYRVCIHHGTMRRDFEQRARSAINAEARVWRRLCNDHSTDAYMLTRDGIEDCNIIVVEIGPDWTPA